MKIAFNEDFMNYTDYFYYDESSPSCLRWKIDIFSGKGRRIHLIKKGDVAGSICDSNPYYRVTLNGSQLKVHRIIAEMFLGECNSLEVDHINGDLLDNKICNLRIVSHKRNMRNTSKRSTNTSGVTGVHPKLKDGVLIAWVADIKTDQGRKSKSFSVSKFDNAFELACKKRDEFLKSNPEYSKRHGT
jgi:hypothetical protein